MELAYVTPQICSVQPLRLFYAGVFLPTRRMVGVKFGAKKVKICTPKIVGVKFQNAKWRCMHFLLLPFLLFVLVIPIEAQYQRGRLNKDLGQSICLKICVAAAEEQWIPLLRRSTQFWPYTRHITLGVKQHGAWRKSVAYGVYRFHYGLNSCWIEATRAKVAAFKSKPSILTPVCKSFL